MTSNINPNALELLPLPVKAPAPAWDRDRRATMRIDESLNRNVLYTIGHSNHTMDRFLELLRQHEITAVVDVRSAPYSRYCSQFNRENLRQSLTEIKCRYVFLGKELGARRQEKECYTDGKVDYEKVATLPIFLEGCQRLLKGVSKYRITLLCSEKNPADCHRTLLISKTLQDQLEIRHILADGSTISHEELMQERPLSCQHHVPNRGKPHKSSITSHEIKPASTSNASGTIYLKHKATGQAYCVLSGRFSNWANTATR